MLVIGFGARFLLLHVNYINIALCFQEALQSSKIQEMPFGFVPALATQFLLACLFFLEQKKFP